MHIISKKPFSDAADNFPNCREAVMDVYNTLKKGVFRTPEELRMSFPSLDNFKYRDKWWVIDICGNHLRLMAAIQFVHQRIYVKHIVSHAEYDKLCKRYRQGDF